MDSFIKKILVVIDGSEEAFAAMQYGVCFGKLTGAEVTGCYVINTRALNDLVRSHIFLQAEQDDYHRDLESDADRYLRLFQEMAESRGARYAVRKESGAMHQVIKDISDRESFDLIVIGELSRIRSRLDETFNDMERTMRYVSCPVLIAKGEDRIQDLYDSL
jgi:nucleotide-binding universal stress UspA family protein